MSQIVSSICTGLHRLLERSQNGVAEFLDSKRFEEFIAKDVSLARFTLLKSPKHICITHDHYTLNRNQRQTTTTRMKEKCDLT